MNSKTNFLVRTAMVAAIYVVITYAFYFLSYDAIQFRISEIMVLLAFIDPLYLPGIVLGCFISNLIGPFGVVDAIFGSLASLFSIYMVIQTRKWIKNDLRGLIIASLWSSVFSFIIAFEITVVFGAPESFWFWTIMVAIGEFVVITLVGVPIFYWILKNRSIVKQLKFKGQVIKKEKNKKMLGRVTVVFVSVFVIVLVGFVLWAKLPFEIMEEAKQHLIASEEVVVEDEGQYIAFVPAAGEYEVGFVFYVGARVDAESYAPMAYDLAQNGIAVYITKPLLNIAFFDAKMAGDIIAEHTEISSWYVGGHSLGGVVAADYAKKNEDEVQGIIFLGAYSNSDLSKSQLDVLSIFADRDAFTTVVDIEEHKGKLPSDAVYYEIKGGNHEQFGWYGHQKGDHQPTITREEQQKEVVDAILQFLLQE